MATSTAKRLDSLTSLTVSEREQLAEDLAIEFEKADAEADTAGMKEAVAGLTRLDMFEDILEKFAEEEDSDEDGDADGDADSDADDDSDDADDDSDKDGEKSEDAPADEAPAEDAPAADADAETTSEAPAVEATPESEVTAMAASAVTQTEDEVKPLVASAISVTARAGAEVDGYAAGEGYRTSADIAKAMTDRIRATAGMNDGIKSVVASLRADFPEERDLDDSDGRGNQGKIDAITGEQPLLASGGFCAPLPVNYDIFGVGSTARPVRDSLPTFGATRGGIRYIQPPVLGSYAGAIALWTALNDVNPTTPATKPVLKVNCANELTASTDAITLSLEFGNLMTRAFPELVQRHNQLALIEHARFAEKTLLSKISALSTKVTVSAKLGTARDLLSAVARASAQYRNRHRIVRGIQLRLLMPDWTLDAIREDIASNLAIENLAVTDGVVQAWFAARGFNISWYMDDTFAAQTAGAALNEWPGTVKFWLFSEGTLLFLDGGTLDLGVIRDAELVSTNDYVTFVETFEGVAKVGIEVLEVAAATSTGLVPVTP